MQHGPTLDPVREHASPAQLFEAFYQDQFALVLSYVMKFGADRAEAEDATQSAMVSLWGQFNEIRHPAAWVRVVARNNWLRAMRRHLKAIPAGVARDQVEPDGTSSAAVSDPADVVRQFAEQEDAVRMIRSLPPAQRQIFVLTFAGYKPAEIAEITGKNASAVRANLAHARRRLSALLGDRHRVRRDLDAAA